MFWERTLLFNTTSNTGQDENQSYWNVLGSMQVKIVITKPVHMVTMIQHVGIKYVYTLRTVNLNIQKHELYNIIFMNLGDSKVLTNAAKKIVLYSCLE